MKAKKLTALFLSVVMALSLMVPYAFAAAPTLSASYAQKEVAVTATGLDANQNYSRISVRNDADVLGLGSGTADASGKLDATIPVGKLNAGTYQVHVYKDIDGTVAAHGSFKVSENKPGPGPGPIIPGPGPDVEVGGQIEDGNYYVDIALWNEYKNEKSMGDRAFENNRQALATVKNGKVTKVQVATNPVNMDGIISAIIKAEIILEKDAQGNPAKTQPVTKLATEKLMTVPGGGQKGHEITYIKSFSFNMIDEGQPSELKGVTYVPIWFRVPDTPMDYVADMMQARLKFDWSTATKTGDSTIEGNSDIGADNQSIERVDENTGIKLNATTNNLDEKVALKVAKPTSGADYDAARKAMSSVGGKWELYKITTSVGGKEVGPSGSVTVSIPCTDKGLTVYRVNPSGTKALIKGSVKDGNYVFNTSRLGLFAVVGTVVKPAQEGFTDVPASHWAKDSIDYVVKRGLFKGTSDTTFAPAMSMDRGMFVTVLARLNSVDLSKYTKSNFTDVKAGAYYAPAVAWAAENGIVKGSSATTFAPTRTITRQEMAAFLARYSEFSKVSLKDNGEVRFADSDKVDSWARESVDVIAGAGLLKGVGNDCFAPKNTASRAEVATLIARFAQGYNL